MELFDQFPPDIQAYILKENPRFRQISNYYAEHGKHLFEETYCNDPINKNEFFRYIDSNIKPNFTIYAINDDSCQIWQFVYNRGKYGVYKLEIKKINNNEVLYFIPDYNYADKTYLRDIENFYGKYKYIHYDIMTVNNIIKARKCTIPNHNVTYSINYLNKMLSYMNDDVTLENFYNMTILNIYFGKKDIVVNVPPGAFRIDFSKMSNKDMINLYNNVIEIYKHTISTGYDTMLLQL